MGFVVVFTGGRTPGFPILSVATFCFGFCAIAWGLCKNKSPKTRVAVNFMMSSWWVIGIKSSTKVADGEKKMKVAWSAANTALLGSGDGISSGIG